MQFYFIVDHLIWMCSF